MKGILANRPRSQSLDGRSGRKPPGPSMVLSQGKICFDKASGATTAGRSELVSAARIQLNVSRVQAVIEHAGIAVTK